MSEFKITPNSTTIITIDGRSAFCYVPFRDDDGHISAENIFTNTLNVLGYIPGVCLISGFARKIFAEIMLYKTSEDADAAIKHYNDHLARWRVERILFVGNIRCLEWDLKNAILSLTNAIKDYMKPANPLGTHDIYPI